MAIRAGRDMGPAGMVLGGILAAAGPRKTKADNPIMSRNAQPIRISMIPNAMSQPRRFL
jgi:hypothetical protein